MRYRASPIRHFLLLLTTLAAASATACGDTGGTGGSGGGGGSGGRVPYPDPDPIPPVTMAPLTTDQRVMPTTTPSPLATLDPRNPADIDQLLSEGYGDETTVAGEPVTTETLDGSAAPAEGPNAKLLTRFVHLSDTQLADDESPTRVCQLDSPGPTDGAFRPQEASECHILNAAVRTINALNETQKLDFVVLGGDNSDNAQTNEVNWFSSILDGSKRVECDSGADDDPVAGPMNDPKDPFEADGLKVPWFWVSGNHDVLSQGNFDVTKMTPDYIGTYNGAGTRDWSQAGGPIFSGDVVVADQDRTPLIGAALLELVKSHGDGHGITDDAIAYGRAYYTFDVPNSPIRFVVVDSTAPTGSADGLILQGDVTAKVKPFLDQAQADGKLVIVTSHHSSAQLTDGGGFGGMKHADALTPDDWRNLLGSYPNVLMHLAGHTHHHHIVKIHPTMAGHDYWEMETSALADWPFEMRMIEIRDLDNGFIGIKAIGLDYSTEGDPIVADGRKRAVADYTSGWAKDGDGTPADRNVELLVPKP